MAENFVIGVEARRGNLTATGYAMSAGTGLGKSTANTSAIAVAPKWLSSTGRTSAIQAGQGSRLLMMSRKSLMELVVHPLRQCGSFSFVENPHTTSRSDVGRRTVRRFARRSIVAWGRNMKPFDDYPGAGRTLIGIVKGANCRHEYGLQFMRKTGQTRCAYCKADFASCYETWLTMALDHVVPASVCVEWGLPVEWREDCANRVLACAACNSFRNRYKPPARQPVPNTLEAFFALRDKVFAERKELILKRHEEERSFFERRPSKEGLAAP